MNQCTFRRLQPIWNWSLEDTQSIPRQIPKKKNDTLNDGALPKTHDRVAICFLFIYSLPSIFQTYRFHAAEPPRNTLDILWVGKPNSNPSPQIPCQLPKSWHITSFENGQIRLLHTRLMNNCLYNENRLIPGPFARITTNIKRCSTIL